MSTQTTGDLATLIRQAQQNPVAFRDLYPRYVERIYAYIAYRVGRQQDREDLVSETFVRALENIGQFTWRGEYSFGAWLFGIARRVVLEYYRQHHPQHEAMPLEDVPLLADEQGNFDDQLIKQEKFAQVYDLLQDLPPRQREIILLRFFGGLRNQEIADMLAIDQRTVASHLSRALDHLQAHYQQTTQEDLP